MEKKLAISPASPTKFTTVAASALDQRLDQRVARLHQRRRPARAGRQHQHRRPVTNRISTDTAMPRGTSRFGSRGFLGGQRHPLDRQEEPDANGTAAQMPEHPWVGTVSPGGVGRWDVGEVGRVEQRHRGDGEDHQPDHGNCGDHEHQLECLPRAVRWMPRKQIRREVHPPAVGDPEQVERLEVGADEGGDRRRRNRILDQDRGPGGEAAPRAERAAGKPVAAARGR